MNQSDDLTPEQFDEIRKSFTPEQLKEFEKIQQKMMERISPEQLEQFSVVVKSVGIMTAVRNLNGSKDYEEICKEIKRTKPGLPEDHIMSVIKEHYPRLVEEEMIQKDGNLSPEAVMVVLQYDAQMFPVEPEQVQLWEKGSIVEALDGGSFSDHRVNRGDKGTIVHGDSFQMEEHGGTFNLIFIVWDKDPAQKPRNWYLEYAKVQDGRNDKFDDKDYTKEFDELKAEASKVFLKQGEIAAALSDREHELMNKFMAAQAGIYRLTKKEKSDCNKLQAKIAKLMNR